MFKIGTRWMRTDFHLHTISDKEYQYEGDTDYFVSSYIERLVEEQIQVAAITNHNKFNLEEYKALSKTAIKKDIIIFPGVELSVKEGRSGIHCLIIFDPEEWISGNKDKINIFLDQVFAGDFNRENANSTCKYGLIEVLEILNIYNNNYLVIMAHVDDNKGFFKELNWDRIGELASEKIFQQKVLGYQKARTKNNLKLAKDKVGYDIAQVEGSDCKSHEDIGKGDKSYIKMGTKDFTSLVLALKDTNYRISKHIPDTGNGYIKSIEYVGGKFDGEKIYLSKELNSLIGIRGSGKSSIIETIRYALDINPSSDKDYKQNIIEFILGSGGKVILSVVDRVGKEYIISRIFNEEPHIYDKNGKDLNIQINSIINNPMYFGQKDLSSTDDNYEMNLIDKMVNIDKHSNNENLIEKNKLLKETFDKLFENEKLADDIESYKGQLSDITHKINIFDENGVSKKLEEQVNYQLDLNNFTRILENASNLSEQIEEILESVEAKYFLENNKIDFKIKSDFLNKVNEQLENIRTEIIKIDATNKAILNFKTEVKLLQDSISSEFEDKKESFAEIKREIDIPNLNPDDYSRLKTKQDQLNKTINQNKNHDENKQKIINQIRTLSRQKNDVLQSIFLKYEKEINKINDSQDALKLEIVFKGDKNSFFKDLQNIFTGTGINKENYKKISTSFSDFTDLIIDVFINNSAKLKETIITERQLKGVYEKLEANYETLLKTEVENKINIFYYGNPLRKHSVGQRASAILLLILMQKENDLIIIDQPEDDLDNKVIYEEIIKEIKNNKTDIQFIFATHNANIPVLGDSEQIVAIENEGTIMKPSIGSIDNNDIQNHIITIMEGGYEAFNIRNQIYGLWDISSYS